MRRTILLLFALAAYPASVFCGDRYIAFERDQAVWLANLDGTGEKKIADGIFPAISPDGTRVAFNTTEKTSDTTYARHIAVVDVATGKIDVFKDVPSDNSAKNRDAQIGMGHCRRFGHSMCNRKRRPG
jgi:hypothetical protein